MTCTDVTMKTVVPQHNSTHNPEAAGSNPVPAKKKPGQRVVPLALYPEAASFVFNPDLLHPGF
jgi:hypothetical protein